MVTPAPTSTATRAAPVKSPRAVVAHLRHFRMSPRKVRLVANAVGHMPARAAVDYLKVLRKDAARPLAKLIASAIANARHNFQLPPDDLVIEKITVNQGPTLKRYWPRAFGRAGMIRRRSCHVSLALVPRQARATPGVTGVAAAATELKTVSLSEVRRQSSPADHSGGTGKAGPTPAGGGKGFARKLFQRKSG